MGNGQGRWGARVNPLMPCSMDERERQVLVGCLLGDGSLTFAKRSVTACFRERKTITAAPYLEWKATQLARFQPVIRFHMARIAERAYPGVFLTTPVSPVFTEWYRDFYRAGGRWVSDRAIQTLTPLSLAIWLQDDGTLKRARPEMGLLHPYAEICSERLPYDDQSRLAQALTELLGERCSVVRYQHTKHHILLGVAATRRMAELCASHWHPCMAYKFPYPELLEGGQP